MDDEVRDDGSGQAVAGVAGASEATDGARLSVRRSGPGWRAWLLSIVAAIVLSVAATLILGGSFRLSGASKPASGECGSGPGSHSCPLGGPAGQVVPPGGRPDR